jgi:hypothetical protein
MPCKVSRDENGVTFHIPADKTVRDPGGRVLPGAPSLEVWWARQFKQRRDETLLIKQQNDEKRGDVLELTLAQAFDLHHALGCAIMET